MIVGAIMVSSFVGPPTHDTRSTSGPARQNETAHHDPLLLGAVPVTYVCSRSTGRHNYVSSSVTKLRSDQGPYRCFSRALLITTKTMAGSCVGPNRRLHFGHPRCGKWMPRKNVWYPPQVSYRLFTAQNKTSIHLGGNKDNHQESAAPRDYTAPTV
jgi:hypothetical protein